MCGVPALLDPTAAIRFGDRHAHRLCHLVGVENHLTADVSCGTSDRLNQCPSTAQEAFFICIEDRDECDLREVNPLSQEVDPNDHVKDTEAQVAQDFNPLERIDLTVEVAHPHARLLQIRGKLFCHALCEGCDDHALLTCDSFLNASHEVIDLSCSWHDSNLWINDAGGADELLHDLIRMRELVAPRGGRHIDRLAHARLKLFEGERAII